MDFHLESSRRVAANPGAATRRSPPPNGCAASRGLSGLSPIFPVVYGLMRVFRRKRRTEPQPRRFQSRRSSENQL